MHAHYIWLLTLSALPGMSFNAVSSILFCKLLKLDVVWLYLDFSFLNYAWWWSFYTCCIFTTCSLLIASISYSRSISTCSFFIKIHPISLTLLCALLLKWVNYARGDHTPLRFVTTCNNGVFNMGILCTSQKLSLPICK